jgi:hypothetical protein
MSSPATRVHGWTLGFGLVVASLLLAAFATNTVAAADVSPSTGTDSKVTKTTAPPARSGRELQADIRTTLRQTASAASQPDESSVRKLVGLYRELETNTDLRRAQREPLRLALRQRLARFGAVLAQAPVLAQQLPAGGGQPGANNAAVPQDHGQELRELIEEVIAPTTWDTVGGQGAIRYWAPGHALIVRQTDDVHDQIGRLLMDLR